MTAPLWYRRDSSASYLAKPRPFIRVVIVLGGLALFGALAYAAAEAFGVVKPLFAHAAWSPNGPH